MIKNKILKETLLLIFVIIPITLILSITLLTVLELYIQTTPLYKSLNIR